MNFKFKKYLYLFLTFVCLFAFANICLPQGNGNDTLTFVQLSDTHFDTKSPNLKARMYAESANLLDDAVNQINNTEGIDFVMFSGDLINRSNEKMFVDFTKHANRLVYPWYAAPGNHDIGINGGISKQQFTLLLNSYNPRFHADNIYYAFEPKRGFKVIVLDTIIDDRITSNGRFSEAELKWLGEELDKNKNDKVLIFEHHPVVEPFSSESHRLLNPDCFLDIVNKHKNVVGVFSGHYHGAKIREVDNIIHASAPSLIQYPNAFRIVTVTKTKNGVNVDFKYKETGLKDVQTKSKMMSMSGALLKGKKADRETMIDLEQ